MRSKEIRQRFIRYFEENGHQSVPSSPLVPAGDPTLLFTNSGMVQFKDVFMGQQSRPYSRAVSVQKCMRAGGKHNDLDQVGKTARHQTFFEMLGNFSFGDYFKAEAIRLAWNFLTHELQLSPDILWVTVHETDDEAARLWVDVAGVRPERIVRLGEDNFWAMGETGPCGPSSEIFVDRGPRYACGPDCGLGRCDCDRLQEIWNLVFMQYNRGADGSLTPLPRPSIDTGMGLERITAYLEGVDSNFDTDLIRPIIDRVAEISGRPYSRGSSGLSHRVIADHVRAVTFLLAEGVSFSNSDRGYVMRRILRRAVRYGLLLGFEEAFLWKLVPVVGEVMGEAYPEVIHGADVLQQHIRDEEERFRTTLKAGMKVLDEKLSDLAPGDTLDGAIAFLLADTYGFPLDLTVDAAVERGINVDQEAFLELLAEQRERARDGRAKVSQSLPSQGITEFVGYESHTLSHETLETLYIGEDRVNRLVTGEVGWAWLHRTPFYPEGGGQVADIGHIAGPRGSGRVIDVVRSGTDIWHLIEVLEGQIEVGDAVELGIDLNRRQGAMRNHTGTHLLHAALRLVLGEGVHQTGSLVAPDRLRFDFSFPRAVTEDEIDRVEDLVNTWILEDRVVDTQQMARDQAAGEGALAFFGDKYGDVVRVVTVPGASKELCGGTHCQSTGQIGLFAVVSESSVGSGSRRLEAVTGWNALQHLRAQRQIVSSLQDIFRGAAPESLPQRVWDLAESLKNREAALTDLRRQQHEEKGRQLLGHALMLGDLQVVVEEVAVDSLEQLRQVLDGAKDRLDAAILAARHGDRASFVVYLGSKVRDHGLDAGSVVKALAPLIGGGGGGKKDLAQAGGKQPEGIPALLERARTLLTEHLVMSSDR